MGKFQVLGKPSPPKSRVERNSKRRHRARKALEAGRPVNMLREMILDIRHKSYLLDKKEAEIGELLFGESLYPILVDSIDRTYAVDLIEEWRIIRKQLREKDTESWFIATLREQYEQGKLLPGALLSFMTKLDVLVHSRMIEMRLDMKRWRAAEQEGKRVVCKWMRSTHADAMMRTLEELDLSKWLQLPEDLSSPGQE